MPTLLLAVAQFPHPTLDPDEVLPTTSVERLVLAERLAREAAARGCGALLLPELFADPTQGTRMAGFAEDLGGPVASWMSRMARQLNMAIAGTVALRRGGGAMTNTALAYDANGRLAGHYDKVHLPDGEREVAAPGDSFPVFDFAGLKAGFQICHDMSFPEGSRILALQDAEIIFWPNMWGGMPESDTEAIMRCRAVDNGVVLASSAFVITGGSFRDPKIHGRSCVVDQRGSILAEVGLRVGVAVASLDLDEIRARAADLAAPGEDLLGAHPSSPSGVARWSGTSFASALVSGAFAVVMAGIEPVPYDEYVGLLQGTARAVDDVNPEFAGELGAGCVDLDAATAAKD